jgi:TusA-related sulfurtransferase
LPDADYSAQKRNWHSKIDDRSFENDLSAWCKLTDNKVLSITKNEEDIFIAYIEKHSIRKCF